MRERGSKMHTTMMMRMRMRMWKSVNAVGMDICINDM